MNRPIIRKINVGPDPKNGLPYIVGRTAFNGKITITRIIETEPFKVYSIFAKNTDEEEAAEFLWKEIIGMPVIVDSNIDNY